MNQKSAHTKHWFHFSIWNVGENLSVRVLDALASILLIWFLAPETLSKVATAQAWCAPLLFLYISPDASLYRDLIRWETKGSREVLEHLKVFRLFGWVKLGFSLLVCMNLSSLVPLFDSRQEAFFALLWAMNLVTTPQLGSTDREYLRLKLEIKTVSLLTLLQKVIYFSGLVGGLMIYRGSDYEIFQVMALAITVSGIVSMFGLYWCSRRLLRREFGEVRVALNIEKLLTSVRSYSLWHHLNQNIYNTLQSMDVFWLGVFGFNSRVIGLYSVVWKVVNFTQAIPSALANVLAVWSGRRTASLSEQVEERKVVFAQSLKLSLLVVGQGLVFYLLLPWALQILGRGQYSEIEISDMKVWSVGMLLALAIQAVFIFYWNYFNIRWEISRIFGRVFLPLLGVALPVYIGAALLGRGVSNPIWAAYSNVAVAIVGALLLSNLQRLHRH